MKTFLYCAVVILCMVNSKEIFFSFSLLWFKIENSKGAFFALH